MNDRADATEKQSDAQWKPRARKPELIKVTERIFCAGDYAISNVGFVITENRENQNRPLPASAPATTFKT